MKSLKSRAMEERVLTALLGSGSVTLGQIAKRIGSGKSLRHTLDTLVADARVIKSIKGHYTLVDRSSEKLNPRVRDPKAGDVYVGVLSQTGRTWCISPINPGLKKNIYVSKSKRYKVGDLVRVKLERNRRGELAGVIEGAIPQKNVVDGVVNACISAYRVPHANWSKISSSRFTTAVTDQDIASRVDYRRLPLVTIDGVSAKDFDDAVYAAPLATGGWRLVVAIADVAHYVAAGSDIDIESKTRGTSVYFPDRVVPMLPERLSNEVCSLQPKQNRLALVCDMELSSNGDVLNTKFVEAVIRSHARLTYTEVFAYLQGQPLRHSSNVAQSVSTLHTLMKVFHQGREQRGALDFDSQEAVVNIDKGNPTHAFVVNRNDAHRLIEEAMICANVAAAKFLEARKVLPLYRIHEPPAGPSFETVRSLLQTRGIRLPERIDTAQELQGALESLRERLPPSQMRVWETTVIRSLQLAVYSPRVVGHFGLALKSYVHFTSPIRRYPDLLVHRLIKAQINGLAPLDHDFDALLELGTALSEDEQRANAVTRKVNEWLKCVILSRHVGDNIEGVVSGITSFGMFIELDEFWVSGLVHVSDLPYDYYEMLGLSLVGRNSGHAFHIGERYRVALDAVVPDRGHINLRLLEGPL